MIERLVCLIQRCGEAARRWAFSRNVAIEAGRFEAFVLRIKVLEVWATGH